MRLFKGNYKTLREVIRVVYRLVVFPVRVVRLSAVGTPHLIAFCQDSSPLGYNVAFTEPSGFFPVIVNPSSARISTAVSSIAI